MRLSLTASIITESPGRVRTMSAADLAASVAPETAMPASAFFSAGASLTPSPVIPTICCFFWSSSTIWYLCSGKTWANPSASSTRRSASLSDLISSNLAAGRMLVPRSTCCATSLAIASWSPVTILTSIPIDSAVSRVCFESSRGGS